MGLVFSSLARYLFGGQYKVVMVGLDNAGKTTILYRLSAEFLCHHTFGWAPYIIRITRVL